MTGGAVGLLAALFLLVANAFFVGASFALVSARVSQIEPLAIAGSRRAKRTLIAMGSLSQMMAGAQLGITICSVGLGALAEPAIAHALEGPLHDAGVPDAALHPIAFSVALVIVVLAHVLLGEMVPKNFTLARPDRAAILLGPPLATFARVLGLVLGATRLAAVGVLRLMRISPTDSVATAYSVAEVAQIAADSHREGLIDDEEYRLMARALAFTSMTAADVAIPRHRMHALPENVTAQQVADLAGRTRHMRFPVLDPTGLPVGYIHAKDLLHRGDLDRVGASIGPAIRVMPTVTPDTPLPDVLAQLRSARAPMAVVAGPSRSVGVLTLDDVVVALIRAGAPAGLPSAGADPSTNR